MRRSANGNDDLVSIKPGSSQSLSDTREKSVSFLKTEMESTHERQFFDHFMNITSRALTLSLGQDDQTILSVIVPMSFDDPMVLNAVLCVGASHLINDLPFNATNARVLISEKNKLLQEAEHELSSRVAALDNRNSRTIQKSTQYQPLLASYLLLYIYEVSEGSGNEAWQSRLDGAREIVLNALKEHRGFSGGANEVVGGDKDVLKTSLEELGSLGISEPLMELFIYHDAVGSVTAPRPRKMIIQNRRYSPSILPQTVGVHNSIIDFVARIATLRSDTGGEPGLSSAGITQAVCIWQDIGNWGPSDTDSELSSDYCTLCEVYIAACFIWLFQMLHPDTLDDDRVQSMVHRGLESLSSIEAPEFQSFALFPVFVIGVASTRQEDREEIEEQFDIIEQSRRFGNIRACRRIIQNSWTTYDRGDKQSWDWVRLMEAAGVSVPLS